MAERAMTTSLQRSYTTSVKSSWGDAGVFTVPRKGLLFPPRLEFYRWSEIGRVLSAATTSSAWCLGDWLIYGETAYEGRYRKAVEETMLDYQTLRNYAWVARRFALSRRRDSLSFGHHAEVAAMSEAEQEYWLRKAEEMAWSRNRLRCEVRASLRERRHATEPGEGTDACESESAEEAVGNRAGMRTSLTEDGRIGITVQVSFSRKQLDIFRMAASASDLSLENWMLRTLEESAHDVLNQRVM